MRDIFVILEHERSEPKLDNPKIIRSLFDSLIELNMVGEHTLNLFEFSHETTKLTIECNEIGLLYFGDDRWKLLFEISAIDLHDG